MAIGDNIPKIFGNLAATSMKTSGDFQYHLDLLNNLDADQEMAFRYEANNPFGPPPPMDGPMIDQMMLMSGGDPMAATNMVIQESMMGLAPDNTELNKNRIAAQALYDQFPGTVDSELINTVAMNMDINPSDLQLSYDNVDARVMFNTLGDIDITSGENLIQSIPGTPNDPPPMPRGPLPEDLPPFDPNSSDYNTSLFGEDIGAIKDFFAEDLRETKELPGHIWGGIKRAFGRGYEPYTASADELERLVPNYQELTEPELDAAIERTIIEGYDPSTRASLEKNDPLIANALMREKESIKGMYDPSENIVLEDFAPAPEGSVTSAATPPEWRGRSGELPQGMDASALSAIGPQVSATYDTDALPATFTNLDPDEQWGPYMQQMIPSYNAPGVQDAYKRGFQPFHGTWLLSPKRDNFASFMHEYKPEQFPQFEWDAFQPQWNELLDWADSLNSNDVSTVTKSTNEFMANNNKLWGALTGEDAAENAVSLALSRYNEGNMPLPGYGSRQLHQSLTTMLNNQAKRDAYTGDPNTITNFLASLAEMNPERFGR